MSFHEPKEEYEYTTDAMRKWASTAQKKKIANKIKGKLDKNDSEVLRKFTRMNPETKRPQFEMPMGTYKKKGDRYIKED